MRYQRTLLEVNDTMLAYDLIDTKLHMQNVDTAVDAVGEYIKTLRRTL